MSLVTYSNGLQSKDSGEIDRILVMKIRGNRKQCVQNKHAKTFKFPDYFRKEDTRELS